ncbi:MAG: transporter substrate-binding domain-containing protein [Enterobacterales bacterium]|nr:transporter substrate-binding domain-containing protein [Enterobacterales bacterium]
MTLNRLPLTIFLLAILLPCFCYAQEKDDPPTGQPLKVVFIKDNAPFSLLLPDGTPTGLYVEFWQLWSKTNHIPIKFYPETFANAMVGLRNHEYDFHVGLFANDQRNEWGEFSIPFHQVETGVFFRGNQQQYPNLSDMAGKTIAVQDGTFQHHYLVKNHPQLKVLAFDDADLILSQLLNNEFDAIASEIPYLNSQIAKMGLRGVFKLSSEKLLTNDVRAFIPKGKANLKSVIDTGIKRIPADKVIAA